MSWMKDGIDDAETVALREILYVAQFSRQAAENLLAMVWVRDGVDDEEAKAIDWVVGFNDAANALAITKLPWVQDGIGEVELRAIQELTRIAATDPNEAARVMALPWVQDGIESIGELTATATPTPLPAVNLVLTASATVAGYWSDGTANVDVDVTLRNTGRLALNTPQFLTLACPGDCGGETNLAMEDGFGPASAQFTLRLPMGRTALQIAYGGDESLSMAVNVPERILGVSRQVWECYSDRPSEPSPYDYSRYGCGGFSSQTVEKWLNDVPIKVWATGDPRHIDMLRQVLSELGPLMRVEFEWVRDETEADFWAHVGIPRSEAPRLGFGRKLVDYWGFADSASEAGEVTSGYVVIWLLDNSETRSDDAIRGVTIHEVTHALVPVSHTSRPLWGSLSPMVRSLVELNYHPLVQPGMSMSDVRELIVLTDELLDRQPDLDAYESLWRAYGVLEEAGSARFKLSGGWIDRSCNLLFGRRRGPIEWSIGESQGFEDNPALSFIDLHTRQFFIAYSRKEGKWGHWRLASSGTWEMVEGSVLRDETNFWIWNGKLHSTIRTILAHGTSEDIAIEQTDGNLALSTTMDAGMVRWAEGGELSLELVIDPETFAILGFTWERDRGEGGCRIYREVATDGQIGVILEVPTAIRAFLSE